MSAISPSFNPIVNDKPDSITLCVSGKEPLISMEEDTYVRGHFNIRAWAKSRTCVRHRTYVLYAFHIGAPNR